MIVKGVFDYAPSSFRRFPRASAKALRSAALLTLLLVLVAHGFLLHKSDLFRASVMLNAAKGSSAQISSGAFLLPDLLAHPRGDRFTALGRAAQRRLSFTGLSAHLWAVQSRPPYLIVMLSGAMALSPSVLAAFAGSIHTADSLFLAVLLAVCAVVLCSARSPSTAWRARSGRRASAGSLRARFPLSLTALCLLQSLLSDDEETPRRPSPRRSRAAVRGAGHGALRRRLSAVPASLRPRP